MRTTARPSSCKPSTAETASLRTCLPEPPCCKVEHAAAHLHTCSCTRARDPDVRLPLSVLARDCDSGLNSQLSYFVQSADFDITPGGVVNPARRLDYERPNHVYEFVVVAVDAGTPPRTGTASVRIRVANSNDEPPVFSQSVYVCLGYPPAAKRSYSISSSSICFHSSAYSLIPPSTSHLHH